MLLFQPCIIISVKQNSPHIALRTWGESNSTFYVCAVTPIFGLNLYPYTRLLPREVCLGGGITSYHNPTTLLTPFVKMGGEHKWF